MGEIKHKELLTFSNLTNLEWQFSGIEEKIKKQGNKIKYPILKNLLTPENFVRVDEKGDFLRYVYMNEKIKKDEFTPEEKEKGIQEMIRKAGKAMNN